MSMLYRVGGRRKFTSWAELSAWLATAGSSYDGEAALVNKTTGLTIGRWAYVGSAITPIGPVRFDRVSASKYALVTSRDSDTQATLTAGHTLPASGTAYVWDTSGAAALHTALAFTVSGNTLTTTGVLDAALAAGDQIWVADTELCVGTGCAVVPGVGAAAYWSSALVCPTQTGITTLTCLGVFATAVVSGTWAVGTTNGHYAVIGRTSGANYSRHGYVRDAGVYKMTTRRDAGVTLGTTIADMTLETRLYIVNASSAYAVGTATYANAGSTNGAGAMATPYAGAAGIDLNASAVTITSIRTA